MFKSILYISILASVLTTNIANSKQVTTFDYQPKSGEVFNIHSVDIRYAKEGVAILLDVTPPFCPKGKFLRAYLNLSHSDSEGNLLFSTNVLDIVNDYDSVHQKYIFNRGFTLRYLDGIEYYDPEGSIVMSEFTMCEEYNDYLSNI